MGVALPKFYLFILPSLRVLVESCLKVPKVLLEKYILPLKCFFLVIVQEKWTLSNHSFRKWA